MNAKRLWRGATRCASDSVGDELILTAHLLCIIVAMAHAGIKSTDTCYLVLVIAHPIITTAVILLSFVLAVGFLMIILSCALWSNWLPLLVGEPELHRRT